MSIDSPPFSHSDREIIDQEILHQGFLNITRYTLRHRLYEGGWSHAFTREIMERHAGVGVLLYDPDLDKVVLTEQFRAGCLDNSSGPWVLELVAGIIDTDESPEQVAEREAFEEAGLKPSHLMSISSYYNSPGGSNEKLHVLCARVNAGHASGVHGLEEENEDIRTVVLTREEALAAVIDGRINNAMSIIALQWLALNLEEVREYMGSELTTSSATTSATTAP